MFRRYSIAIIATLAAAVLRGWLDPVLGEKHPYALFVIGVMITARYCGIYPAALSLFLGYFLGNYLYTIPRGVATFNREDQISLLFFTSVAAIGAFLGDSLIRDIERRKRVESALAESELQLQRHRNQVAHMARVSMMGEMAASLAHELNQPLHAVRNYARGCTRRLAKEESSDPELVGALDQIAAEACRASDILRRVRDFVRNRDPQVTELAINPLIEEVVKLAEIEVRPRGAQLQLELGVDLPFILADPIQIEQVLMNLIRNGLEAMDGCPEDQRIMTIRTAMEGDDMIRTDVADRGLGIAAEQAAKVFEPFHTTKTDGLGMGLAISRSIVEGHGGKLEMSPCEGGGSVFHFTLPVTRRD